MTLASVTPTKRSPLPSPGVSSARRGRSSAEWSGAAPLRAVMLPGSGSDARFVWRAFGAWARSLPRAATCTTTLAALGADPAVLGRAAIRAWQKASSTAAP